MMENPKNRKWKVLTSEYLARKPWFTVRHESLELPDGRRIPDYYVFEYPDWINVTAVTRDGRFVLIDQYRHGLGETSYEIPAGVTEPSDGSPLDAAQRVRVLIGLFEHDFRARFRHDAALARNAEFLRKVAADSGDDFDRFHYFTSTEGTSTPESCIVCIMCRCAARRARSLSCSRIPRYISKWHWLAR